MICNRDKTVYIRLEVKESLQYAKGTSPAALIMKDVYQSELQEMTMGPGAD